MTFQYQKYEPVYDVDQWIWPKCSVGGCQSNAHHAFRTVEIIRGHEIPPSLYLCREHGKQFAAFLKRDGQELIKLLGGAQ